jgi:DNA replication protein DnaC
LIDEIGYLSYSNRHADLLFEIVSRRYQEKSTLVTTNRPFAEWGEVFPNAACVVSLVGRRPLQRADMRHKIYDNLRFTDRRCAGRRARSRLRFEAT